MDSFITDLYGLERYCNFGTLKEKLIRDHIVVGLRNCDLSEKFQLDSKLTLKKAMNLARQSETVKQQQRILVRGFQSKSAEVDSIAKGKPHRKKQEKPKEKIPPCTTRQSKPQSRCPRFLGSFHPKKTCPAHTPSATMLKSRSMRRLIEITRKLLEVEAEGEEAFFLGEIVDLHKVQSHIAKLP